jgi:hypothetical protein
MSDACSALAYLHRNNIVHGDIKVVGTQGHGRGADTAMQLERLMYATEHDDARVVLTGIGKMEVRSLTWHRARTDRARTRPQLSFESDSMIASRNGFSLPVRARPCPCAPSHPPTPRRR